MKKKHNRYVMIWIILLFLVLFAFASPQIVNSRSRHFANSDFFSFWLAAKMTWQGQNPFNPELWAEAHYSHGATWIGFSTFLYPPALSVILAPIALIPIFDAFVLWVFLSITSVFISMIFLLASWLDPPDYIKYMIPIISGVFLFRPFIATLLHGQINAFLLLLLILSLLFLEAKNWFWGGFILGILLLKPNLGLVIVSLVCFWALLKGKRKFFTGLTLCVLTIYIISQLRLPGWITQYYYVLISKGNQTLGYNPSLWGLMGLACNDDPTCVLRSGSFVSVLVFFGILFLIYRKRDEFSPNLIVSLALSTMLLVTPYLWAYDQILLIVPIIVLSMELKVMGYPYFITASLPLFFSLIAALLAYVGTYLHHDIASVFLSMLLLVLIIWISYKNS